MTTNRTMLVSLVLALAAFAPAAALAKHGADDSAAVADDNGGQRADDAGGTRADDNGGRRGDDASKQRKRARARVRVAGECTGDSTAKLTARRDRGRLKAELEVDQNVAGVTWAVQLRRNDTVVVDTTRTTRAPSGSLRIERRLGKGAGPDTVSATATSPSGEVCTASATV